jgi:hypothetical protein
MPINTEVELLDSGEIEIVSVGGQPVAFYTYSRKDTDKVEVLIAETLGGPIAFGPWRPWEDSDISVLPMPGIHTTQVVLSEPLKSLPKGT